MPLTYNTRIPLTPDVKGPGRRRPSERPAPQDHCQGTSLEDRARSAELPITLLSVTEMPLCQGLKSHNSRVVRLAPGRSGYAAASGGDNRVLHRVETDGPWRKVLPQGEGTAGSLEARPGSPPAMEGVSQGPGGALVASGRLVHQNDALPVIQGAVPVRCPSPASRRRGPGCSPCAGCGSRCAPGASPSCPCGARKESAAPGSRCRRPGRL